MGGVERRGGSSPAGIVRRAAVPLLALLLVLVLGGTALGVPRGAATRNVPGVRAALLQDPSAAPGAGAIPGLDGSDACGLLTDDEVLRATGAAAVVSRAPGSQMGLSAGCDLELTPPDDSLGITWSVLLGVQAPGGRAQYDQERAFDVGVPQAGIGDEAVVSGFGGGVSAVKGDVEVAIQVIAMGGGPSRPAEDMGRLLAWRILSRIDGGSVAPVASPSPAPSAEPVVASRALAERLRAPEFGQDQIDAAIEILARSGVATYAAPDDPDPIMPVTVPESPMRLLLEQVRAMALEAWAGGGMSGQDLDALSPAPDGLASGSEVVAGYVMGVDTEGAAFARELMGTPDLGDPTVRAGTPVPQLVLTLLVSDVARDRMAAAAASGHVAPQPARAVALAITTQARTAAGGLCSQVMGFIDQVIGGVFDALRLGQTDNAVGSVLVSIWNVVVSIAEASARAIVKQLTQPVLDLIANVAGTVATASLIVSALRPWTLVITADPAVTEKGVDGAPGQEGKWTVRVDLGGLDEWPPTVADCAAVAGRPLPNLKPENAPVAWSIIGQQPGDLVGPGEKEEKLDKDGIARFPFTTLVDDVKQPYTSSPGWIGVTVVIERPAIKELRQMGIDLLIAQIPGSVRGIVTPYVRPILDRLTAELDHLLSSQSSGTATVIYHRPAPTPEPGATPPPDEQGVMVQLDRPDRPPELPGTVIQLISCTGPYGAWSGFLRLGGIEAQGGLSVPFAEFPLAFAFTGASGLQSASDSIAGDVPTNLPTLSYAVSGDLRFLVDGKTMTITGTISGDNGIVGVQGPFSGGPLSRMPIVPAPAGAC